ncbi:MAG: hypothetical protein O7F11_10040 [Acidobacteria bacterium]|nr:hypothetical protein [Acidobacteriota bacterium]
MAASRHRLSWLLFLVWAFIQPVHAETCRPIADLEVGRVTTNALTATEERLQGRWEAYHYGASSKTWTISFDQRRFRAEGEAGDWYTGRIEVRVEIEPSELDFLIEDCQCKFKSMTSRAIFRWEGERLVMAAPEPGAARPPGFDESSGQMMELCRFGEAGHMRPQN